MRHKGQIELCGYSAAAQARAETEIQRLDNPLAKWQVWDETQLLLGVAPDVSVVDTRGKDWGEVVRLVNEAHGTRIVLLGNDAPRVGLQVVPDESRLEEVIDEAFHDTGFGVERAADTVPAPLSAATPYR
jgi:hypothetical protein